MIDQFENLSAVMAAVMVLVFSLMGSFHCVGMCGPLSVMAGSSSRWNLMAYHLGRLTAYMIIGTLAGYLGEAVLASYSPTISLVGSLFVSLSFFWLAWCLYQEKGIYYPSFIELKRFKAKIWSGAMQRFKEKSYMGFGIGLFSLFLPCGWLYTFVISSVVTQSALWGAVLLFFFWLGTLPALSVLSLASQKPIQFLGKRYKKVAAALLLLMGMGFLAFKIFPLIDNQENVVVEQNKSAPFHCPMCE